MVCALPQVRAVRGLFLFSGCELGIGLKPSAQGAAKPYVVENGRLGRCREYSVACAFAGFYRGEIATGSDGRGSSLPSRKAHRRCQATLKS
jgi:hypothetical protein